MTETYIILCEQRFSEQNEWECVQHTWEKKVLYFNSNEEAKIWKTKHIESNEYRNIKIYKESED